MVYFDLEVFNQKMQDQKERSKKFQTKIRDWHILLEDEKEEFVDIST